MTRVALITSDHRRHLWLAGMLAGEGMLAGLVGETKPASNPASRDNADPGVAAYFEERERKEAVWFADAPDSADDLGIPVLRVPWGGSNSRNTLDFISGIAPDCILLFGSSIIREPLLDCFSGRVLNMHLGLSPYYRGSATNFWPLVDGLPECVGVTIHHATLKVDAGNILRQARPPMDVRDTSHDVGCKTIISGAELVIELLRCYRRFPIGIVQSTKGKLCRRSDFTPDTLVMMQQNFETGMIQNYISNKAERDARYPIVD